MNGSDWLNPTECRLTGEWALERVQRSRVERNRYDLHQRMYWRYRSQGGKGPGAWKGQCLLITCAERMSTWRRISACRPSSMKLFQTRETASMSISLIISCVTPRRSIFLRPLILTDWNCLWRRWRVMTGRCRYIPLSFIGHEGLEFQIVYSVHLSPSGRGILQRKCWCILVDLLFWKIMLGHSSRMVGIIHVWLAVMFQSEWSLELVWVVPHALHSAQAGLSAQSLKHLWRHGNFTLWFCPPLTKWSSQSLPNVVMYDCLVVLLACLLWFWNTVTGMWGNATRWTILEDSGQRWKAMQFGERLPPKCKEQQGSDD